jgi:hypothetical protein
LPTEARKALRVVSPRFIHDEHLDHRLMALLQKIAFLKSGRPRSFVFWLFVAYLSFVFLTGGGSRPDIQSLIVFRPVGVLVCGIALLTLQREHVLAERGLCLFTAATFLLVILHLVPLPPALWHSLAGRELFVEVDRLAGIEGQWRPLALVPPLAWNAFFSLFVPLAVLLLGVQLTQDEKYRLLPILLVIGLMSGIWGLFQIVGEGDGPLYLYKQTTNGAAVGFFANRNHQAVLLSCLLPALSVFAGEIARNPERAALKKWLALGLGIFLVPLILVTGFSQLRCIGNRKPRSSQDGQFDGLICAR